MNINLKNYQEKAVGELIATFKSLLAKEEPKKFVFFKRRLEAAKL